MEVIRENMARAAELRALQAHTYSGDNEYHISETKELVKMQEESRQEQAKGEHEEQIHAVPEARDHDEKVSEDVKRQTLMERANAEREKWVSAINTAFKHIGGGIKAILTDQNKMVVAVGGMTALAAGIYTTRCSRR